MIYNTHKMYRQFVDNTIKEFQHNNEEEINRFMIAFFNDGCIIACSCFYNIL